MLTYAACCGIPWHIDVKNMGEKFLKTFLKKLKRGRIKKTFISVIKEFIICHCKIT